VEVEIEWLGPLRITGVPVVYTARESGGKLELLKEGFRILSANRWELKLSNVSAHTIYKFVWKLDAPPVHAQAAAAVV